MNLKYERILDSHNIEYLYHMTHIDNLESILRNGLFSHKNKYQKVDISDCDVNSRRSRAEPIYHKLIHSYVPFYINPKNAMLYKRQEIQNEIVILKLRRELIYGNGTIFTDGNASSQHTSFSNNLNELHLLDWDCLNDDNWYTHDDGRRTRMSEVLVPNYVCVDNIEAVICNNIITEKNIKKLTSTQCVIDCVNKFYF